MSGTNKGKIKFKFRKKAEAFRFGFLLDKIWKMRYNILTYKECVRDKPCDRRQPTERQGAKA